MNILLIILGIIVFCGIIRVIITPSNSIGEFILDILFLDLLGDVLQAILEHIDFD
jgi:hypothetical protein